MSNPEQPQQACQFCRRQKRRCDKRLPTCGTCRRSGRECNYVYVGEHDEVTWLRTRVASLESALRNGSSVSISSGSTGAPSVTSSSTAPLIPLSAPDAIDSGLDTWSSSRDRNSRGPRGSLHASFFLDNSFSRQMGTHLPSPLVSIPQILLSELGSAAEIVNIADTYFTSIHVWLPMVWKRRIYKKIDAPDAHPEPGLAVLLAAMKLIHRAPRPDNKSVDSLYQAVKGYTLVLENDGFLPISMLQACLLVAAYEIGHGIYPAAYMSIGRCGRLGQIMGIHNKQHAWPSSRLPDMWGELEEIRRTWSAVLVLERYVNVGFDYRSLSNRGFSDDDILPCDTQSWNRGDPAPSQPLFVQAATKIATDPFARACQVAHLLGRIIDHRDDTTLIGSARCTTAMQLLRTLNSLLQLLRDEFESDPAGALSVPYALASSAKTVLINRYACTETHARFNSPEESEMQAVALGEFQGMVDEIVYFGQRRRLSDPDLDTLSPLICDCLYQAAATAAWYLKENGSERMARSLEILTGFLRAIQNRWHVAGAYLVLIESLGS